MDEERPQEVAQDVVEEKWYTPLTRETSVSKVLATVVFVILPFLGFWLGMEYGKARNVPVSHSQDTKTDSLLYCEIEKEYLTNACICPRDSVEKYLEFVDKTTKICKRELVTFNTESVPFTFSYPKSWGEFIDSIPDTGDFWQEVRLPSETGSIVVRTCPPDSSWFGCNAGSTEEKETFTSEGGVVMTVESTSHKGSSWTSYVFEGGDGNKYLIQLVGPDSSVKSGNPYAPNDGDRAAWMRSKIPEYNDFIGLIDSIALEEVRQLTKFDDTTSWQLYENSELGFSIEYPSGYEILEEDNHITFSNDVPGYDPETPSLENTAYFSISIDRDTIHEETIAEWWKSHNTALGVEPKQTTIDNHLAVFALSHEGVMARDSIDYYMATGNDVIIISFRTLQEDLLPTYEHMLHSIHIIE